MTQMVERFYFDSILSFVHLIRFLSHFILSYPLSNADDVCFDFTHLKHITSHHWNWKNTLWFWSIFAKLLSKRYSLRYMCVYSISPLQSDFLICRLIFIKKRCDFFSPFCHFSDHVLSALFNFYLPDIFSV